MEPDHMLPSPLDDPAQLKAQHLQQPAPPQPQPQPQQQQHQKPSSLAAGSMSPPLPPLYINKFHQRESTVPAPPPYPQSQPLHPAPASQPQQTQGSPAGALAFPEVPTTELPPIYLNAQNDASVSSLPSLSTVVTNTSTASSRRYTASSATSDTSFFSDAGPAAPRVQNWPSLNPFTAYYTPSHVQQAGDPLARMDVDAMSTTTTVGPASPDRWGDGRASSVSLDDPDVRMAAEALGDLRADFVSSPPNRNSPLPPVSSPTNSRSSPASQGLPGSEPLLSLLTTSHPLLARTIEGTTTAYNTSKNFSPRIKTGVEYVEGYLAPIASTVGSVGRVTGVEGGVRWFLRGASRRHQHSGDLESGGGGSNKRRRLGPARSPRSTEGAGQRTSTSDQANAAEQDPFGFPKDRRTSISTVDTLPAYDAEFRSPAYSELATDGHDRQNGDGQPSGQLTTTRSSGSPRVATPTAWQSRLIMSTSGLSIAMSEESLRSLKYCLRWLKWANDHIGRIIGALKDALERYDSDQAGVSDAASDQATGSASGATNGAGAATAQDQGEVAARIAALRSDVLKTLRDVVDTVSKYAGGALPENARLLVRRHLTSLPQRFRLATQQQQQQQQQQGSQQDPEHAAADADAIPSAEERNKDVREGAQRVLVLAKEGLDMMAQVSGVLDGTIVSAEEWCDRLGRKRRGGREEVAEGSGGQVVLLPSPPPPAVVVGAPLTGVEVDGDVKMT